LSTRKPPTKRAAKATPSAPATVQEEPNPRATAGNNSNIAGERLKSIIERIEQLNGEKAAISEDVAQVYAEAKGGGFDTAIIRQIVTLRKKGEDKRKEEADVRDAYMVAIGMDLV
jgi:uncharacterized protein (UPF0335 family)